MFESAWAAVQQEAGTPTINWYLVASILGTGLVASVMALGWVIIYIWTSSQARSDTIITSITLRLEEHITDDNEKIAALLQQMNDNHFEILKWLPKRRED